MERSMVRNKYWDVVEERRWLSLRLASWNPRHGVTCSNSLERLKALNLDALNKLPCLEVWSTRCVYSE